MTALSSEPEHEATGGRGSRRLMRWALIALVALLLVGAGIVFAVRTSGPEPVYIAVAGDLDASARLSEDTQTSIEKDLQPGIQLALDRLNEAGGIGGREVRLLAFDDDDDPELAAQRAEEIVDDGRALAVIGHSNAATSAAAAPLYAEAGLPAISAMATGDDLTVDRPWYFQGIFDNGQQGVFLAAYLDAVLDAGTASIVWGSDSYGTDLYEGFTAAFGEVRNDVRIDLEGDVEAQLDAATARLAADPERGAVIMALRPGPALLAVPRLREAGIADPIVGADELGAESFFERLHTALEGVETSGDVYATAPILTDSLTGPALEFVQAFKRDHGHMPGWPAVTGSDMVALIAHALDRGGAGLDEADREADRLLVRDTWQDMSAPESAAEGLTTPLYFDGRTLVRPVRMSVASGDQLVSAPTQLVPYSGASGVDVGAELAEGDAVRYDEEVLVPTQIVTTGVNINEISGLDTKEGTFTADMFVWFAYVGGDEAVDVRFANALDPSLSLGDPLESDEVGGVKYRLFHVSGTFKASFEFGAFPFDEQQLPIVLQNRTLPDSSVIYVLDKSLRRQSQEERLRSAGDEDQTIDRVPNWLVRSVWFTAETVGTSANMGRPDQDGETGVYYSQFVTDVAVSRDVPGFLTKNLLPLALLVLATYASLYLPYSQVTARVSMAVTGILSSAVMLNSVTSVLPDISYTVAIEWVYYLFILLCVCLLGIGLLGSALDEKGDTKALRRLSIGVRIGYPAVIAAAAAAYCLVFA